MEERSRNSKWQISLQFATTAKAFINRPRLSRLYVFQAPASLLFPVLFPIYQLLTYRGYIRKVEDGNSNWPSLALVVNLQIE